MNAYKKYLTILLLSGSAITRAQLATTDPAQTAQNATMIMQNAQAISTAIDQFKELKKVYRQGQESYREFVQIKDFIKASEERMANIGDIKQLKLNDINILLDKVFCLKQGNYFTASVHLRDVIQRIKAGFLNCDNRELYTKTIAGVLEHFQARVYTAGKTGQKETRQVMKDLGLGLKEADKAREALNGYDARMKLELGLKYKAISDELMELSEEVHLAINEDKGSDRNIALSPAERMSMMDMANRYQVQAMEYEERSAGLLKEASEMNEYQQKKLLEIKRDLAYKEIIRFSL